jgi:hypothetical protein
MREEFERFSKIIAEHGGLPIDNDQLAASAVIFGREIIAIFGSDCLRS